MRRVVIGALLAVGVTIGCEGPFSHSNPFDSYAVYSHDVQGVRTTSDWAGDTLDFQLISTPSISGYDAVWTAVPGFMSHVGNGRFATHSSGLATRNIWIRANYGFQGDSIQVQIRQLPESLSLRCQGATACEVLTNVGAPRLITSTLFDVNGRFIPVSVTTDASSLISRDPSIVSVSGTGALLPSATITAQAEGSTWVVGTIAGRSDSLLVTVDFP